VSPNAIRYVAPIPIHQRTVIHARVLDGAKWSAIEDGTYLIDESPAAITHLRISEINFNPHDPLTRFGETGTDNDEFEFIELVNVSSVTVDLTGVKLVSRFGHGVDFEFGRQSLPAGQRVVVPRDRSAFGSRYGPTPHLAIGAAGDRADWVFAGDLDNDGDALWVVDAIGRTIQTLSFGDSHPWPSRADGNGSSLELADLTLDAADPGSWRASTEFGGSPGTAGVDAWSGVVINEILANLRRGGADFIELMNISAEPVDIGNWYISDSSDNNFRSQVRQPTIIPPRGCRCSRTLNWALD
jgi:hypothetical protein